MDNYIQTVSAVKSILAENPSARQELSVHRRPAAIREVSNKAKPDNILNYFYTLIAMARFTADFSGREITISADISPLAARMNTAPVHKLKAFIYVRVIPAACCRNDGVAGILTIYQGRFYSKGGLRPSDHGPDLPSALHSARYQQW